MFSLGEAHRYFLYREATDMRKGFNGLSGLVRNELDKDPLSGDVFVFINRSRNRMKLLVWEGDGFLLLYKRLEKGRFEYPRFNDNSQDAKISWQQLMLIVKGIDLKSVKKRKRFSLKKKQLKPTKFL